MAKSGKIKTRLENIEIGRENNNNMIRGKNNNASGKYQNRDVDQEKIKTRFEKKYKRAKFCLMSGFGKK